MREREREREREICYRRYEKSLSQKPSVYLLQGSDSEEIQFLFFFSKYPPIQYCYFGWFSTAMLIFVTSPNVNSVKIRFIPPPRLFFIGNMFFRCIF